MCADDMHWYCGGRRSCGRRFECFKACAFWQRRRGFAPPASRSTRGPSATCRAYRKLHLLAPLLSGDVASRRPARPRRCGERPGQHNVTPIKTGAICFMWKTLRSSSFSNSISDLRCGEARPTLSYRPLLRDRGCRRGVDRAPRLRWVGVHVPMAAIIRLDAALATEFNVAPPPVSAKERELIEASVERTRKILRHTET